MRNRFFQSTLVVFVLCTLVLSGCSDFDEMKSRRLLIQAEGLMQQGHELQAEQALADLVARYPRTQSGEIANKRLSHIQKQRVLREREAFTKVLDSFQQVLNGYYALYAEYPRSTADLDQSGYFFDSAYLEEITPDNFQAYLWLEEGGSSYRVWCVTQELERGYAVESRRRELVPFNRDATLKKIKERFQASDWNRRLVILQLQI